MKAPPVLVQFSIFFPRYLGKTTEECITTEVEDTFTGQETILVVEDEPSILDITCNMIELSGFRCLPAGTPAEALYIAGNHAGEINILITDVVMPEMNRRELAKRFLAFYPASKCLFMSGYDADVVGHRGVLDSGTIFLQKPFSRKLLVGKLMEILSQ